MWKVKIKLPASVQEWLREYTARYDTSRLSFVRFYYTKNNEINGTCWYPEEKDYYPLFDGVENTYRIACGVPRKYPYTVTLFCPPVYRKADGTWPPVPPKCEIVKTKKIEQKGKTVEWRRIAMNIAMPSLEVTAVYLFGHEFWHYLRETRQIPGRNTQTQADMFGLAFLRMAQMEGAVPFAGPKGRKS
jgi:hypothetical protein